MFNAYAARLMNAPAGSPLSDRLRPYFGMFCDPVSDEYWPELAEILREQHPAWFGDAGRTRRAAAETRGG